MKSFFAMLFITATLVLSALALAYTPAETRTAFKGCQDFMKLSKAEQKKRAEGVGYELGQARRMCQFMLDRGLEQTLKDEAEYQRGLRSGGNGSGGRSHAPECTRSLDCPSSSYHCVGGTCQNISSGTPCSSGLNSCVGAERCIEGVCR